MSLLRRFIEYATDPEVVAGFQKACGIVYAPNHVNSGDTEPYRHQNGISTVMNGKTSPINGVRNSSVTENGGDVLKNKSDTDSSLKHRNGKVNNNFEEKDMGKMKNGIIHTGTVPFRIENRLLYYLFCFGAQLGNAVFYITFYSFSFWNFDSYVTRRICLVWCVCMYFGQATKDIVRVPRPKSPPVVRLETRYELEYGMPSTHAIVATALPFSMLIFTSGRYEYPLFVGVVVAIAWCLLVCLSRIYLGMHNILDVIVGLLFAVVVMTFTVPFVDPLDKFLITHPLAPIVLLSLPILLTLIYPTLDHWSTCRGDTTLILSITAGIFFGTWLNNFQGFMSLSDASLPLDVSVKLSTALVGALRLVSGIALIVSLLQVVKTVTYSSLCYLLQRDPKDPKTKQSLSVELPYKYLTYFSTAMSTVYVCPLMFHFLGISRMSYYTEL